jgi:hypothetical protein
MIETNGKFYLGRNVDPDTGNTESTPLLYDPDDLTTHAVVVGMTGSGKTGLCIDLLEEAALNNVPALMIDPKGDITNALLHFPELRPQDFQPWVNADEARRDGKTVEQAAADAAGLWQNGLAEWGITPERIRALEESAHFAIYTPGSDAGIPVSILASLKAPAIPWSDNREILLEKISGTVTALLGLVGLTDIDPVRSREHILLANIFENAWSEGRDLNLSELILQTQSPPFEKLGVFEINTFFPKDDRFELAMLLNNIMASPSFQTWIEGQPLDVGSLLYGPDGRPRHSVFYIAHLNDAERMFFVTLLFSAVETWMRSQTGTASLRALVYFDEIFGYLPPTANPPSKEPMLRMLKQARSFGVGLMLVTQNPVDVDYKALSNAGTWFIGKLQTDQDKQRLLDGLEGAAAGLDRGAYDRMISNLGKRVFLLHNVHEKRPVLFHTRWAMNYLAGPLTRVQIPALNQMVGAGIAAAPPASVQAPTAAVRIPSAGIPMGGEAAVPAPAVREELESPLPGSPTHPAIPAGVQEFYLPQNLTLSQAAKADRRELPAGTRRVGLIYRPVLLAQAEVRFLQRKYNLNYEMRRTAIVPEPEPRGAVRWDDYLGEPLDARAMDRGPAPQAHFAALDAPFSDGKIMRSMESDFQDWGYRTFEVNVWANESLKVYAGPEVSEDAFREMCAAAAEEKMEADIKKAAASFEKKIDALKKKLTREERELSQDEAEFSQRKMEEMGTHLENVAGLFGLGRKRRVTTSLSKRRMTEQAKADVEESKDAIEEYKEDIVELEADARETIEDIDEHWEAIAEEITTIPVTPYKKDVLVELFGVGWHPYHVVEIDGRVMELPGFGLSEGGSTPFR